MPTRVRVSSSAVFENANKVCKATFSKKMRHKQLENLIKELKTIAIKEKVKLWKRIASELEKSSRRRRSVNIARIKKHIKMGEIAVVPGKVVGTEKVENEVVAYQFSATVKNNNRTKTLSALMKENPKAKKCRIFG